MNDIAAVLPFSQQIRLGICFLVEMSASKWKAVRILFGTATGTAEDVGHALAQRYSLCGLPVAACAHVDSHTLAALPLHAVEGCLIVFIIATAGDGEAPRSMVRMWTAMRAARLRRDTLAGVDVAVFGLGDRSYQKFNAAARRLATRLGDLGANLVVPLALGDDSASGGYDAELEPWRESLLKHTVPGYEPGMLPSPLPSPKPRLGIKLTPPVFNTGESDYPQEKSKWQKGQVAQWRRLRGSDTEGVDQRSRVVESVVRSNDVMTNPEELEDDREVRQITLEIPREYRSVTTYVPGDVVHVMCRNRASAVIAFFQLVGADPGSTIDVVGSQSDIEALNILTPCSLFDFVSAQLDLSAMPGRRFIERLAAFAANERERQKLVEFSTAEGTDAFVQYAYREKRTILMVLRDFPSARPPLPDLLDMIPALRPRAFSIASSSEAHGNSLQVCAAIVRYTTPLRFARVGVCSAVWLGAQAGDIVPIYFERGTLRFDASRPAIMVGPGTGVAPMRSFISSLQATARGSPPPRACRILYFGCRHARGDFLYENEWKEAVQRNSLTRVEAAFSRESPGEKVYVQNLMRAQAAELWRLVESEPVKAVVYVAGAAGAMPKAIRSALANAAQLAGGLNEDEAERYVRRMESTRRLQVECW